MPAVLVLHPRVAVAGQHRRAGPGAGDGEAPVHAGQARQDRPVADRVGVELEDRVAAPLGRQFQGVGRSACSAGPRPRCGTGRARGRRAGSGSSRPPAEPAASSASKSCCEYSSPATKISPPPSLPTKLRDHLGPLRARGPACRGRPAAGRRSGRSSSASFGQPRDRPVARPGGSPGRRAGARRRTRRAGRACRALRRNWTSGDGEPAIIRTRICWRTTRTAAVATLSSVRQLRARRPRPGRGTRTGRPPWA